MSKSSKPSFGDLLKKLREGAGLSQRQLAEKAGMHQFGVAKLEQGLREPSWATVQALAGALGVNCLAFTDAAAVSALPPPKRGPGRPRKATQKAAAPKRPKRKRRE
jgi:transcriptional regulator with XRE-family HTH domain